MRQRFWFWVGARLLVAILILGWGLSYLGRGSGEKEFQKALDAMKQVHSFRVATRANPLRNQHSEISYDVDCQRDLLRYHWHFVDTSVDPAHEFDQNQLYVAGREYDLQPDGSWAPPRNGGSARSSKVYCRQLSEGTDTDVLPKIATMIKRGVLQKGDKKTVNGVRCREWLVTMKGGWSGLEHDTLCIGLDDHLPHEMTVDWENSRSTFTDYNAAIPFDIPDAVQASTAGASN